MVCRSCCDGVRRGVWLCCECALVRERLLLVCAAALNGTATHSFERKNSTVQERRLHLLEDRMSPSRLKGNVCILPRHSMGLPLMPISWGGARGPNVGIYGSPISRVWVMFRTCLGWCRGKMARDCLCCVVERRNLISANLKGLTYSSDILHIALCQRNYDK